MQVKRLKTALVAVLATVAVAATGCSPKGIPVGPVAVSVPLQGGEIDPGPFALLPPGVAVPVVMRQDFCSMPTEDLVVQAIPDLGPVGLSRLVTLTSIDLTGTTLVATGGDFGFVREMVVSFIPKPVHGQEQEPVELGRAASSTGFGNTIRLEPTDSVDLLDLIRENDANTGPGCPQLEIRLTGTRQTETVTWQGEAEADVYGVARL